MLKALTAFFESSESSAPASREKELELATAVLLIEVARADFSEDEVEVEAVASLLENYLGIADHEAQKLVERARQHADHAASLQAFTRQLHEELDLAEKHKIIELLWCVALADETLDKHEDHLIRKVAGLLYISHGDLIRIRNQVTGH